jgi:hypothetical protein
VLRKRDEHADHALDRAHAPTRAGPTPEFSLISWNEVVSHDKASPKRNPSFLNRVT